MKSEISFSQVLEYAEKLGPEEQETLIDILHRRAIESRRREIAKDIREARREFQEGRCRPSTPAKIMKEILS